MVVGMFQLLTMTERLSEQERKGNGSIVQIVQRIKSKGNLSEIEENVETKRKFGTMDWISYCEKIVYKQTKFGIANI